jgi:hypothetical protein
MKTKTKAEKKEVGRILKIVEMNRNAPPNLPELPADPPAPTVMQTLMAELGELKTQRGLMAQATMELRRTRAESLASTSALQEHELPYEEYTEYDGGEDYVPSDWCDFDDPGVGDFAYLEEEHDAPGLEQYQEQLMAEVKALKQENSRAAQKIEPVVEEDVEGLHLDLIKDHLEIYQEPKGKPVTGQLATHITQVWKRGHDIKRTKEVSAKLPMPENIPLKAVDLNQEVMAELDKFAVTRDRRLCMVQALTTRALMPLINIANLAMRPEELDRKSILDTALDAVQILAAASATQNSIHRDVIRPKLSAKFKQLCGDVDCMSPFLLGDDMASRIKQTQQSVSILGRGRGQFGSFRGSGQRFSPYARGASYGGMGGFRRFNRVFFR